MIEIPNELTPKNTTTLIKKISLGTFSIGLSILLIGFSGIFSTIPFIYCITSFGLGCIGAVLYILSSQKELSGKMTRGTFKQSFQKHGIFGYVLSIIFMAFYIALYFFPESLANIVTATDPISELLRNKPSDRWFFYGTLYTFCVAIMGIRFLFKFNNSPYQRLRTISVIFFQTFFSFFIPALLEIFHKPSFYFHYFWPLKPEYLFPSVRNLTQSPELLVSFMGWWAIIMAIIGVPVLTYYFGKRWYCSWVCGCGALAETLGDPFRHLSDKSLKAWKIERITIHSILLVIMSGTVLLWVNSAYNGEILTTASGTFSKWYGFFIGSIFSGVIGTGFYPIMGSRIWCRFGCPQAAILGIIQKYFSRFRITTNGGQCISCGNCSTYCEMGIDVRSYAQRGENIIRASCVGCGVCSSVCPRGVLKLENVSLKNRMS